VKAVIAESFERIHRTNLVGMGVLPLQFVQGDNAAKLKLTGKELFHITGVQKAVETGSRVDVKAITPDGDEICFQAVPRVDTPQEAEYFRQRRDSALRGCDSPSFIRPCPGRNRLFHSCLLWTSDREAQGLLPGKRHTYRRRVARALAFAPQCVFGRGT
jgi:hypothetical protein